MSYPVSFGRVGFSKKEPASTRHRSPRVYTLPTNVTRPRRSLLEARAGDSSSSDFLDKTWDKQINKATTKWKKSVNGKALKTLFEKTILASPDVEVAHCSFLTDWTMRHDVLVQQLATFESIVKLISTPLNEMRESS
jgi:hypothetical protein